MKELIKHIRSELQISQEQLSKLLSVSAVTVNRWENSKSHPAPIAQKQLYELCKNHNLNLTDFILDQIKSDAPDHISVQMKTDIPVHTLYHASRSGIIGRIQPSSRSRCDFGRGFYMGTDPLQPLTLVCNEEKPIFYTLEMNLEGLRCLDVVVGIDWAMLIAYFRGYMDAFRETDIYQKYAGIAEGYDVISGFIADDRMYQVLTDFFEERITDAALLGSLSALQLGRQYVAISKKACDRIQIKSAHVLSQLELMTLKDTSIIRRKEGLRIANRVVREHRRDGRYFDEIMEGAKWITD